MEFATASFWLDALAAGAAVVWFVGAWFVSGTARAVAEPLRGEAEVACAPAAVLAALGRAIAGARFRSPLQGGIVESVGDGELRWRSIGPWRHRGRLRVAGAAGRAHVTWEIEPGRMLLTAARLVVFGGALVVVGLYFLLHELALPNENPGVRGQVFQMVQAIHLLWPPFLLAGLSRRLRRLVGDEVARAVQNAPFA
ncbi:MAG: hypothetical protein FJ265_06260 [Planctomycetes bacterium]|nr:hypothetical protein [Planctomycetota bacterium]